MNRIFYYIITLCLISFQGVAQWYWEYPLPQGNNLNDLVIFEDTKTIQGYAVGDKGYILSTTDTLHANWTLMESGVDIDLHGIDFIDSSRVLVVGKNGTILGLNPVSNSWNKMISNTLFTLKGVTWVNEDIAFAVGSDGIILKYENQIWLPIITGEQYSLNTVCFVNDTTGIAAGFGGAIMRTVDGGENWNIHIPDSSIVFNDIDFPSENVGYMVGNKNIIVKTENAGLSWNKILVDSLVVNYNTVRFFNDTIGYVAGDNGKVYYTRDGGKIWAKNRPFVDMRINAMYHKDVNSSIGEIVVGGENGIILRSGKWGEWDNVTNGSFYNLVSLISYSDTSILAFGGYPYTNSPFVLRYHHIHDTIIGENDTTVNIYLGWEPDTLSFNHLKHYITDVFYIEDDTLGFMAGYHGGLYILNRDDSCTQLDPGTNKSLYAISGYQTNDTTYDAFAAGGNGLIVKATIIDTLYHREFLDTDTENNLFGISMPGLEKDGYAVGDNGTLLLIRNGGSNIAEIPTEIPTAFYDIEILSDTIGFMVGAYGTIAKFEIINEQYVVKTMNSGVTTPLVDVYFQNDSVGYAVGDNGVILKTENGGDDWRKLYSPTNNHLKCILFKNDEIGYLGGYGSTILKTENAGGPFVPNPFVNETKKSLLEFSLYPNPTVDEVSLDYFLSNKSKVQIIIYDLSGRKIEQVLNETQNAGKQISSHQVSHLNKGIYIITLQVGRQISAKKMAILR